MTPELKERIAKIYELVKRGTDGEQAAAQTMLDRLVKKYGLEDEDLDKITLKEYGFKYSNSIELRLMRAIVDTFVTTENILDGAYRTHDSTKEIRIQLNYLDYVTISCAYEYFKRHMRTQWTAVCLPQLKRIRKAANRKKKRETLEALFFEQYIIKSKLIDQKYITKVDPKTMTNKEAGERMRMRGITGGQYNKQVNNGLMLEAGDHGT